ncbi:MAG: hypothetical protein JNM10_16635 [Planctomycetia bacterium]|nr:hypothetical protein [Planctomycetia bacterium]
MANDSKHKWRFWRAGGVDQVRLDRGVDLVHLDQLDQKLWVALACPVKGLEFDERTLALLDTDKDGRVRAPELIAASRWLGRVLKDPETLVRGADAVPLANLDAATPEGKRLLDAAQHVLEGLGKTGANALSVDDATRTADLFAKARLNGDGVVPPDTVKDPAARAVGEELLACLGGVPDRSGKPGFDAAKVDAFFAACAAFAAWHDAGAKDAKTVLPLGAGTAAASAAVDAVRAKVDEYFLRCRIAAYDARAVAALARTTEDYYALAAKDLAITSAEVTGLPVALAEPGKPLPLAGGVNPAWADAIAALHASAVAPILGKDKTSLTEAEWAKVVGTLAPHRAWAAGKAGLEVEKLGAARVQAILASGAKEALQKAVAEDLSVAPQVDTLTDLEKLARCHRDFHTLANNFVAFTDFYARRKATFQVGTLFVDGRSCDLCVQVNDGGKHGTLGAMARSYLVYADCSRPGGEKMQVAAAMTAGDGDNLFVGRNGLFYDRKGRDWDATIAKIVDNPISIRQAFWAPYKKVLRFFEEAVAKRAAAADEAATANLQATALATAEAGKAGAPPVPPKPKFEIGTIAALGVAIGGIATAFSAFLNAFFGLGTMMPLGVLGIILLISGPAMIVAWMKLRRRNLGPLLDANGWAVNTLTKINLPLGRSLTDVAALPPGSERSLIDPYAEKRSPWPRIFGVLLLLALIAGGLWKVGLLSKWVPQIPAPEVLWFESAEHRKDREARKAQEDAEREKSKTASPAMDGAK